AVCGPAAHELRLDLADAASHLHDRRALEPLLAGPVGDPRCVALAESLPEIPLELAAGALDSEDVERLTGAARAPHATSMTRRSRRRARIAGRRQACGMRASRAAPSASRTGSSSIRSSTSWKNPRTISRSASERGSPRAIR